MGGFFAVVTVLAAFGATTDEALRGRGVLALGAIAVAQLGAGVLVARRWRRSEWLAITSAAAGALLSVLIVLTGDPEARIAWLIIAAVLLAQTYFVGLKIIRR